MPKLYRADQHTLDEIIGYRGFYPRGLKKSEKGSKVVIEKILSDARKNLCDYIGVEPETKTPKKSLESKLWGNEGPILSTAVNDNCAGQIQNTKGPKNHHNWSWNPVYEIVVPNLKKYSLEELKADDLGFQPYAFKKVQMPILYMNDPKLKEATVFGIQGNKHWDEVCIFTLIEKGFITLHKKGKKFKS